MKVQFYIGLIAGSLLGAATIWFATSPGRTHSAQDPGEVTNKLTSKHTQILLSADQDNLRAITTVTTSDDGQSAQTYDQQNTITDSDVYKPINCDRRCGQQILDRIFSGYALTTREVALLGYGSHHIAELIQKNEDAYERFSSNFLQATEKNERSALIRVIAHLPERQAMAFIEQLNNGSDQNRVEAIELLTMLAGGNEVITNRLEQLVQTETNPVVLAASMGALNSVTHGHVSDVTLNSISNQLLYSDSPMIQGKSMELLTQWQYLDGKVEQYIQQGLNSSSHELKHSSLQSLSNILNSRKNQTDRRVLMRLQEQILAIANNTKLPPDLRMQALSIINRHLP